MAKKNELSPGDHVKVMKANAFHHGRIGTVEKVTPNARKHAIHVIFSDGEQGWFMPSSLELLTAPATHVTTEGEKTETARIIAAAIDSAQADAPASEPSASEPAANGEFRKGDKVVYEGEVFTIVLGPGNFGNVGIEREGRRVATKVGQLKPYTRDNEMEDLKAENARLVAELAAANEHIEDLRVKRDAALDTAKMLAGDRNELKVDVGIARAELTEALQLLRSIDESGPVDLYGAFMDEHPDLADAIEDVRTFRQFRAARDAYQQPADKEQS